MGSFVNTYYRMTEDFIFEHHPWKTLKEHLASTFPKSGQLEIMKSVMDGNTLQDIAKKLNITVKDAKSSLVDGMKTAELKNIYDLVLWGLKTGIIQDKPLLNVLKQLNGNVEYADWNRFLNQTVTSSHVDFPKSTQSNYKQAISKMFNVGPSDAEFIRFAFRVINPIKPPTSFRGFKPFVSHFVKTGVSSKFAMVPSKFKAADIDPNLHPNYQPIRINAPKGGRGYLPLKSSDYANKGIIKPSQKGSVQMALKILGIHPDVVKTPTNKTSFWQHKSEDLWHILELARTRFDYEIAHAHPDRGGDVNRAKQVTIAWRFVREMFKRRGYELHK